MIELLTQTMSLFDGIFYDLNVHSIPEGADSITRLAYTAKRYGYSGIAIINSKITDNDMIHKPENFSIFSGIEVSYKPSKLRNELRKYKEKKDILIVQGGDEDINRAAVEAEELDILMQPVKFNHVLAKIAYDNSVTLGFNVGSIIKKQGEARIRELSIMRKNLKLARKYNLPVIITTNSYSHYDLRSPREMGALAGMFGMTEKEASDAMGSTPLKVLERKNQNYIQEGIEIL